MTNERNERIATIRAAVDEARASRRRQILTAQRAAASVATELGRLADGLSGSEETSHALAESLQQRLVDVRRATSEVERLQAQLDGLRDPSIDRAIAASGGKAGDPLASEWGIDSSTAS